ncbi:MAG TPA: glycogen debranching protein GlgX [Polyangia bacterium]|nr:glycogen debranching protein GlgX [Polyangia bacterium]
MTIGPGHPHPLGATLADDGVNFAVFSRFGTRAFICLFDPNDPNRELARHELPGRTAHVFHGFIPGVKAGALYGVRVDGPYEPNNGHRFNVHKLLLDPYARAIAGRVDLKGPICGYRPDDPEEDLSFDERDSALAVPRSVVVDDAFDWGDSPRPNRALCDSVIYELHVKGFTRRHPEIPEALRGTYLGLAQPAAIRHLKELGVTAVELLPIQAFDNDGALADRGLVNYWGYNTLGYFAPHAGYASSKAPGAAVAEVKQMVRALHEADLEVILDVVYNHTWEGNHKGPTLSFRGLDNASYYLPSSESPRYSMEFSGCGNILDLRSPYALQLVLDSLRRWAIDFRVDGFRFDLASALGREGAPPTFDAAAGFFRAVHQDPVLSRLKLIAEPWDTSDGGYQLGHFPVRWSEWNGQFRDALRRFWKGDENLAGQVGYRLTGSADLFEESGRCPSASINFVTCHDGFTLHDLVTYGSKHNDANREGNRDGADDNQSWNHGVEGETTDTAIRELRARQERNILTTLFLARGVPMLTAGDEMLRTQRGNNNAYCLDDETTWIDWTLDDAKRARLGFVKRLIALRAELEVVRMDRFFTGEIWDKNHKDLAWYRPDGTDTPKEDWERPFVKSLQVQFGHTSGRHLLFLINADAESKIFTIPPETGAWIARIDTRAPDMPDPTPKRAGDTVELLGRALVVLVAAPEGAS